MHQKDKKLYIIPGYRESTRKKPYRQIAALGLKKKYKIIKINPKWNVSLVSQIVPVGKNDVIFGFSLGGILALLIAQKFACKKVILASATTHKCANDLKTFLPADIIKDIRKTKKNVASKVIRFYGEFEREDAIKYLPEGASIQKFISKTEHNLSEAYIDAIDKVL